MDSKIGVGNRGKALYAAMVENQRSHEPAVIDRDFSKLADQVLDSTRRRTKVNIVSMIA